MFNKTFGGFFNKGGTYGTGKKTKDEKKEKEMKKSLKKKKAKAPKIDKAIAKDIAKPKTTYKEQRYVAQRNVEKMKNLGWKVIGDGKDAKGKIDGTRSHITDLVLMQK